jgi:hypothetical protein
MQAIIGMGANNCKLIVVKPEKRDGYMPDPLMTPSRRLRSARCRSRRSPCRRARGPSREDGRRCKSVGGQMPERNVLARHLHRL